MSRNRSKLVFGAALTLVGAGLVLSLLVGRYPIDFSAIPEGGMDAAVFFSLRLPRTLMALLAGAALGVSGCTYQTVFRNPLAAPDIIGVASGATVGAAAALLFFGWSAFGVPVAAFIGSFLAVLLVLLMANLSRDGGIMSLVLSGIAVNALCSAVLMLMKLTADPEKELASIEFWTMGSFADATKDKLFAAAPFTLIGLLGLFLLRRQVQLLCLSEDEARMLGVPVGAMRCVVLALATLVTASVISVCGLISFVGLIAPHIARMLRGRADSAATALSALVGGGLLLLSDVAARSIGDAGIPVSIVTSFVGAPFLLILMARRKNHGQ